MNDAAVARRKPTTVAVTVDRASCQNPGNCHCATSQERLGAAIAAHMRFMLTKNDIARASIRTLGQAPAEVQGPSIELHRACGHYFSALIEDAKSDGFLAPDIDARVLRLLIIGAAN